MRSYAMSEYIVDFAAPNINAAMALCDGVHEEIVRCRDCRYCMAYWKANYCDYFNHSIEHLNGFCAWGERKEHDGE